MKTNSISPLKATADFLRKMSQQSVVALMATVVSICALILSVYQVHLSREQQLASVWPYLSINGHGTAIAGHQSWGIQVVNNGLGPAIIESVMVRVEGATQPFQVLIDTLYAKSARLDSLRSMNYAVNEIGPGTVLSAGTTTDWISFDLQFSGNPPGAPVSQKFIPYLDLSIQYKSLYGERWESCFNCADGANRVRKID